MPLTRSFLHTVLDFISSAQASKWNAAVKEMVASIGRLRVGGPELRQKIRAEVDRLKAIRFELFCAFA